MGRSPLLVYVLYKTLRKLDANVDYRIPDRKKDGYGINLQMAEEAAADGTRLILTCDNGISAREPVRFAKAANIKVLITDHHDIPMEEDTYGRMASPFFIAADNISAAASAFFNSFAVCIP